MEVPSTHMTPNVAINHDHTFSTVNIGGSAHVILGDVHITEPTSVHNRVTHADELVKLRNAFLKSVSFPEFEYRYHSIDPAMHGTCQWFLEHKWYRAWEDGSRTEDFRPIIWLRGKPGAGKSTIMRTAIEASRAKYKTTDQRTVKSAIGAFFFNARGGRLETRPEGCYRTFVHQLFQHAKVDPLLEPFSTYINKRDTMAEGWQWTEGELKIMFRKAITTISRNSSCLLYLDALDECDPTEVRSLVDFLVEEMRFARLQGHPFKLCVSSRHYPNITLDDCFTLLAEQHNEEDITTYAQTRLTGDRATAFLEKVTGGSSGIFLWTKLVISRLREAIDDGESDATFNEILSSTVQDLEDIFAHLWKTLKPFELEQSRSILLFVLFAKQPLNLSQLALLLAYRTPYSSLQDYLKSDRFMTTLQMEKFITKVTRGLVEVIKGVGMFGSTVVQFIHGTVREFFLDHPDQLSPGTTTSSELAGYANDMLARACFNFAATSYPRIFSDQRKMGYGHHPLALYVGKHAFAHGSDAERSGRAQEHLSATMRLDQPDPARWMRLLEEFRTPDELELPAACRLSIVSLCAKHGLLSVLRQLPSVNQVPISCRDTFIDKLSCIPAALDFEQANVDELLVSKGLDHDRRLAWNRLRTQTLQTAALKRPVNVDLEENINRTIQKNPELEFDPLIERIMVENPLFSLIDIMPALSKVNRHLNLSILSNLPQYEDFEKNPTTAYQQITKQLQNSAHSSYWIDAVVG